MLIHTGGGDMQFDGVKRRFDLLSPKECQRFCWQTHWRSPRRWEFFSQPVDPNKGKYSSDFQLQLNLRIEPAPIESDTDCQARLNMAYLLYNCFLGFLAPRCQVFWSSRCWLDDLPFKLLVGNLSGPVLQVVQRLRNIATSVASWRLKMAGYFIACSSYSDLRASKIESLYIALISLSLGFFQRFQSSNPQKRIGKET